MSKPKFQITAQNVNNVGLVKIIGHIGWDTDCDSFRDQCDEIKKQGVKDVHVYIMTPGGSCFDADEIANIINSFEGKKTGEGGALVASAGTRIAAILSDFSMPENGQFMVHKPKGSISGTNIAMRNYLALMDNTDKIYYDTYMSIVKDKEKFKTKWDSGDWWMTASEARDEGFITSVKPKIKIDREAAAVIKACCSPIEIDNNNIINQTKTEMELKVLAVSLGLDENASEEQVNAKIKENAKAAADLQALQTQNEEKEKEDKAKKVKACLDKAIADKRIKADARANWEKMLTDNFETASAALESISPLEKPSTTLVVADGKKTYHGKTFEQLQDENPELLDKLEKEDPDAFAELFNQSISKK